MKLKLSFAALLATSMLTSTAVWAEPEIVAGPGAEPECFAPW